MGFRTIEWPTMRYAQIKYSLGNVNATPADVEAGDVSALWFVSLGALA